MSDVLDGCPEFDARLIDQAFSPGPDAPLDEHLSSCPRCRRARDRYLRVADALGACLATGGLAEMGPLPALPSARRPWRRPLAWAAAAALLIATPLVAIQLQKLGAGRVGVVALNGAEVEVEGSRWARLARGSAHFQLTGDDLTVETPLGMIRAGDAAFLVTVEEGAGEMGQDASSMVSIHVERGSVLWQSGEEESRLKAGSMSIRSELAAGPGATPAPGSDPETNLRDLIRQVARAAGREPGVGVVQAAPAGGSEPDRDGATRLWVKGSGETPLDLEVILPREHAPGGSMPLAAGEDLVVTARGFSPVRMRLEPDAPADGVRQVQVQLAPGRRLEGQLLTPDGDAVVGARVAVLSDDGTPLLSTMVRTGTDGRFRLESMPPRGGRIAVLDTDLAVLARYSAEEAASGTLHFPRR